MESEDRELEQLLASLSPKSPSSDLRERIRGDVDPDVEKTHAAIPFPRRFAPLIMGTAAAFAIGWLFWGLPSDDKETLAQEDVVLKPSEYRLEVATPPLSERRDQYRRVDDFRSIIAAEQGPLYILDDDRLVRNIHIRYLDTTILESEDGSARFTVSSPREEILVVPAASY